MGNPIVGTWSYRSFINNPDLSVAFNDLAFGAGTLVLENRSWAALPGL